MYIFAKETVRWSSTCKLIPSNFFISSASIETVFFSEFDKCCSFQFLSCTGRYPLEQAWIKETHFGKVKSVLWPLRLPRFCCTELFLGDWKHFSKLWLWDQIPVWVYACVWGGRRWDQAYLGSNPTCLQAPKSELESAMPSVPIKP